MAMESACQPSSDCEKVSQPEEPTLPVDAGHPNESTRKRKLEQLEVDLGTRRSLWQQQVPHLYDLVVSHRRSPGVCALQWPAGAAQLGSSVLQRMVLGSQEALLIVAVRLPWDEPLAEESEADGRQQADGQAVMKPFVRVTQYMKHEGPVKSLACSPQVYLLTATQTSSGDVLLFRAADWQEALNQECRPERRLKALESPPSGCCWMAGGHLLSGNAKGVHLWDVEAGNLIKDFSAEFATTAVAASMTSPDLVMMSCSDGCTRVWDRRSSGVVFNWQCHQGPGSCVELKDQILASGGCDSGIVLYELRQPTSALCSMTWDDFGSVTHLAWSPWSGASHLSAAYADGRVLLWDLEKAKDMSAGQEASGVVFMHGGHSGRLPTGLAWSQDCPRLLCSSDVTEMQFWRPSSKLFMLEARSKGA